jgi:molybdopterin molybdotransferase
MLTLAEAWSLLEKELKPLPAQPVRLDQADGCQLQEPIVAQVDHPGFDNSAVDGYAVRVADLPGELPVAFEVFAGSGDLPKLAAGTCARIMTGARVPQGAEAVVMKEDVNLDGDTARFSDGVKIGQHIRRRSEEYQAGDLLVKAGARITPPMTALIASQGLDTVTVLPKPRAAILTTGDELRSAGEPLNPGEIYESNSAGLAAAVRSAGLDTPLIERCSDDFDETVSNLRDLEESHNLIITSGGASVGDKDHVITAAKEAGFRQLFWKCAIKPGKPIAVSVSERGTVLLALPGNPVSAMVCFVLFGLPTIAALRGKGFLRPEFVKAKAGADIPHREGRMDFVRGSLSSGHALPVSRKDSHMMSGLAGSEVLIVVPAISSGIKSGEPVAVVELDWRPIK